MRMFDIVLTVIIELARIFITLEYFRIFLDCESRFKEMLAGLLAFLLTTGCFLIISNNYINTLSTIAGIIIISLVYEGKIRSKLLLSILCYSIMVALDFIVYMVTAVNIVTEQYQVVAAFVSVLFFYIVIMMLRLGFRKKLKSEFMGQWYILFIVSIMSVCTLFAVYKESGLSSYGILFMSTSVLILNLMLYVFYSNMVDRYIFMQENENLKQQMHYYDAQMKTNIENDKKIRAIRHDMKHHIREINSLAEAGKLYELKKYSDELMGDINGSETVFNTGNITLDGIFNYYNGKFKDKCIETDINVVVPENMGISAMDINIIMGNLLDNAYENAIKVKDSYIKVNVKYNGNMLYIYVSNTFDGKVEEENGNIVSLKGKEHGYGLENINRIAEKYGGNIKIEHSDKRFVVSVIMYIIN